MPTDAWARAGGPNAERLLDEARAALTDLGMVRVDVELPESAHANEAGRVLLGADHYAYHRRALADGAPYSSDMHARARQWQAITPAEVAWATAACGSILEEWSEVFRRADVVMLPANLAAPPQHGEDAVEIDGAMLPVQQVNSRFNRVSNLTGNPALVLPAGESSDGFPIAAQLVGPRGEDAVVLRAGLALEQALGSLAVAWGINPAQR